MPLILFIIFVATPLAEIAVFIQVGGLIGLWPTLGLVVLTAIVGTWMLRRQGFTVVARARAALDRGELPVAEVFDGACLLVAGVLLLTPGFVTDAFGGLLLVPPVRRALQRWLAAHIVTRQQSPPRPEGPPRRAPPRRGPVIEGEYEEVAAEPAPEPTENMPPPRGGWGDSR
jgi:UPF0716 protein FxsA